MDLSVRSRINGLHLTEGFFAPIHLQMTGFLLLLSIGQSKEHANKMNVQSSNECENDIRLLQARSLPSGKFQGHISYIIVHDP